MNRNLITVVQPPTDDDSRVRLANGTQFFLADGTEIKEVTRAIITFATDEIVSATIDLAIEKIKDLEAHPLLGFDTLREAAKHYGYQLVPIE